ncbi:hypothetical protein [Salidesulfovibrio onnuriiensis]|uniref:hypothetical protein n=1 Tax=Salidesulfovibrio onnuriiensis TaxID=2583823 RepID=UPI0011C8145E|nr:hypothetical protein [Salidesulfovibrio onnuriiensis]
MRCPKCSKPIKKQTLQCPHCGQLLPRGNAAKKTDQMTMNPKLCMAVGLLMLFIGFILLISDAEYFSMLPLGVGAALLFLGKKMRG